jgi:3-phenylpropionate/trans-cinnamate dioxygenase ferredoxin subunit
MHEQAWHRVVAADEVPENSMRRTEIGGREVVVCRSREGWHALDNICTHAYARMDEGRLRGTRLICPLHGASFDCRTGAVLGAPATAPLARHSIRVVDGWVEVALSGA